MFTMLSPRQVMKCADLGAEIVRITVQGMQEAKAAEQIKNTLVRKGYNTPLVADIHFAPKVAMLVAESFDKIRINPGNFADGRKSFETINYEDEKQYQAEVDYIEEARPAARASRPAPLHAPAPLPCASPPGRAAAQRERSCGERLGPQRRGRRARAVALGAAPC